MLHLSIFVCISICLRTIDATEQSKNGNKEIEKVKHALHKATKIFTPQQRKNVINSYLEDAQLIQHNINLYDELCNDIELFGEEAEKACSKYEDEMTDYIRNISLIPNPPQHDTIQWYWAQQDIWKMVPTQFVCFQSIHFKQLLECLCSFCAWPFVVEDEKYDIYTKWKNEYEKRNCKEKTDRTFMNTGDNMCHWMNISVGTKGEDIAKEKKEKVYEFEMKNIRNNSNNSSNSTMDDKEHNDLPQSSAPMHLNNIPVIMTIVTVLVMICSALFFVATV